jgi:peptidoglycan-associated lipoprotein
MRGNATGEGAVRKVSLLGILALGLLVAGGCPSKPKGELGETRPGQGTAAGQETGAGETGAGDRGEVTSLDAYGLKPVYFDFDKYNLREDARQSLDANAEILRTRSDLRLMIEGHCDERGTDEYNLALGERRARAAQDYLVRLGVEASRLSIISYGEERPAQVGHDEDSWRWNRRAEFVPK